MSHRIQQAAIVALVAGCCGYAGAATIAVTSQIGPLASPASLSKPVSLEGSRNDTTDFVLVSAAVKFGRALSNGYTLQLDLGGGAKVASAGVASISVTCTGGDLTQASEPSFVPATRTATDSTVLIDIANLSSGINGVGGTCTFHSVAITASSLTSEGNKTIGGGVYNGSTLYDPISDVTTSSDTNVAASVRSQVLSVALGSAFNGVIDFQDSFGYGFAADDGSADVTGNSDNLVVTVGSRDTANSTTSAFSLTFSLAAESGKTFAFLNTGTGTGGPLNRSTNSTAMVGGLNESVITMNATATQIDFTGTAAVTLGNDTNFRLDIGHRSTTPSTGVTIEPMTFPNFTATASFGSVVSATGTGTVIPGAWTSNGSVVQIPYMPINSTDGSAKIDPVIVISNRADAVGTISAVIRDEAGNTCLLQSGELGTIGALRTKSIGGLIRNAVAGSTCSTLDGAGGEKVAITLTINLPSGSTDVYSGYTVGGASRVTVVNSSNGK